MTHFLESVLFDIGSHTTLPTLTLASCIDQDIRSVIKIRNYSVFLIQAKIPLFSVGTLDMLGIQRLA